ncbi:MAG: DegT/DnrJ/EryC1/StrS family aminotransferase [Ilumatobacteraceae bacterium]|nr:DegT/DnrJ/EryC1/StrS family aminotransferase [Ilumatobacteraceae bacterium]
MSAGRIELSPVRFDERAQRLAVSVLQSGQISQGPMVEALEARVSAIAGTRHAIAVNNGTASLIACLRALGVGRGDEVITSPFTFVATVNAVLAVGATPRFADISSGTFDILPDSVEALVNARTRALLPVHVFGHPADMTSLCAIADRHGLAIIEDAAQALGAAHCGRAVGSFGLGSFSLYATKNVTTGEGGVVTTDDDSIAQSLREFRNQGLNAQRESVGFGLNLRLTDLQAAVGLPQLDDIEETTRRRTENAALLSDGLTDLDGVIAPSGRDGDRAVHHHYTLRVLDDARVSRDALQAALTVADIASGVYYRSLVSDLPHVNAATPRAGDECPSARAVTTQVLSIPVHQHLSGHDIERIVRVIRDVST